MAKARLASAIFVILTLLAACSCATSSATLRAVSCPYDPIDIDTSSLPKPVIYPPRFSRFASASSGSPTPGEFEELRNPPVAPERLPITVTPQGKYVRNYAPLKIQYSDPNKKNIAGCGLTLRTYNGELVGPTLHAKPGQTLGFTVENNLPKNDSAMLDMTNLHTHGMQVDPVGKYVGGVFVAGDNVLINYGPAGRQEYEITVPGDHPSGTFWYHAHSHGSTAVQVSSGMAGELIVEDDKNNLDKPYSDRSMLPDSLKVPEKTLVFQ